MCRSIKVLRRPEQAPTADEYQAAALQFVRKISGFHKPSKANQQAFDRAVEDIAATSRKLLDSLATRQSTMHTSQGDQSQADADGLVNKFHGLIVNPTQTVDQPDSIDSTDLVEQRHRSDNDAGLLVSGKQHVNRVQRKTHR
jgi:hypothetical protein